MRLIDADALEKEGWSLHRTYQKDKATMVYEVKAISEINTAQPEIIRCKDCKYRGETEDGEYDPEDIVCEYWMSDGLSETDYCSYAERRQDG